MNLVKLDMRKIRLGVLVLGSILFMASTPGACDVSSDRPFDVGGPTHLADVPSLMWSRDGEDILFTSGGLLGVYVVDSAGRNLRAFPETAPMFGNWDHPGTFAPELSPDGSHVAYSVWAPKNNIVIEKATFDGTDVRRLTPLVPYTDSEGKSRDPYNHFSTYPVWSPDGKQIAFIGTHYPPGDVTRLLYVMDADGSNSRALALSIPSIVSQEMRPVLWSPDGNRLALVGYDPDSKGHFYPILFTVKPDGSRLVRVTPPDLHVQRRNNSLEWSPDGTWLAFSGFETVAEGETRSGAYAVRADGSGLTRLTPPDYGASALAWSPDGAWLAFTNGAQVNVVRPDGAELRQVASGHGGPLVWTPDGEEILIGGLAYAVRPDGSGLRAWASGGLPDVARTAWSPDGSRLAVLTYNRGLKLFTIERDGTNKRLLMRGTSLRIVAEHSDWRDVSDDIVACAELYEDNPGLVEDCQTLLRIRDTLAGETLLNWSAEVPIRDWQGVSVEGDPPRVRRLVLSSGSHTDSPWLTGVIPPEMGNLSELEWLYLSSNALTGSIPAELGNLNKLKGLRLRRNYLTGSIPPELGNLVNLKSLDLRDNILSGDVPPELGNLENLERLELHGNNLSGCVPAVLADRSVPHPGIDYCE